MLAGTCDSKKGIHAYLKFEFNQLANISCFYLRNLATVAFCGAPAMLCSKSETEGVGQPPGDGVVFPKPESDVLLLLRMLVVLPLTQDKIAQPGSSTCTSTYIYFSLGYRHRNGVSGHRNTSFRFYRGC